MFNMLAGVCPAASTSQKRCCSYKEEHKNITSILSRHYFSISTLGFFLFFFYCVKSSSESLISRNVLLIKEAVNLCLEPMWA